MTYPYAIRYHRLKPITKPQIHKLPSSFFILLSMSSSFSFSLSLYLCGIVVFAFALIPNKHNPVCYPFFLVIPSYVFLVYSFIVVILREKHLLIIITRQLLLVLLLLWMWWRKTEGTKGRKKEIGKYRFRDERQNEHRILIWYVQFIRAKRTSLIITFFCRCRWDDKSFQIPIWFFFYYFDALKFCHWIERGYLLAYICCVEIYSRCRKPPPLPTSSATAFSQHGMSCFCYIFNNTKSKKSPNGRERKKEWTKKKHKPLRRPTVGCRHKYFNLSSSIVSFIFRSHSFCILSLVLWSVSLFGSVFSPHNSKLIPIDV